VSAPGRVPSVDLPVKAKGRAEPRWWLVLGLSPIHWMLREPIPFCRHQGSSAWSPADSGWGPWMASKAEQEPEQEQETVSVSVPGPQRHPASSSPDSDRSRKDGW
jgi:hypothetical protein